MQIENIHISQFRNIQKAQLEPGSKINFILGDNAQGKTNFIEAIYVAALLKSFRTRNTIDLIQQGKEYAILKFQVGCETIINTVNLTLDKQKKLLKINGKKPNSDQFFKHLNIVIFHPDEVNYICNYPIFRRNLIDRSIFYTNFEYIDVYRKYTKCLKQRNSFLKQESKGIDCWEDQLVKFGSLIISERLKYIKKINDYFSDENFFKTSGEHYHLVYSKEYKDINHIQNELRNEFFRKRKREKLLGYTLVGPHKEDIGFFLNQQSAGSFASQGQKRSLVISLKTAQILDYQRIHGYCPVLILDDMTSELDVERKNILLENLLANSGQVFITSTDFKQIIKSEQAKVFRVKHGEISQTG